MQAWSMMHDACCAIHGLEQETEQWSRLHMPCLSLKPPP